MSDSEIEYDHEAKVDAKEEDGIPSSHKSENLVILPDGKLSSLNPDVDIPPQLRDAELKLICVDNEGSSHSAVLKNGQVVTFYNGGEMGPVQRLLEGQKMKKLYSTSSAFAALTTEGEVVAWGNPEDGGDISRVQGELKRHRVQQIYSTDYAFVALTTRGQVVSWGHTMFGGDSRAVQGDLKDQVVQQICSTDSAFAALLGNGRVATWGLAGDGGDSSKVQGELMKYRVEQIYSTKSAFAALLENGRVVTWGNNIGGGDSSVVQALPKDQVVQKIYSTDGAFAALTKTGRVVTWGYADWGGDSSRVQGQLEGHVVEKIYSTGGAFAALTTSGSICEHNKHRSTCRDCGGGGICEHNKRRSQCRDCGGGRVVTWGLAYAGGDSNAVQGQLSRYGVEQIYSTAFAFAAVLGGGRMVSWGGDNQGLINIPNGRKVMEILGNTVILDNWDVLELDDDEYSLKDDPNYIRFIRNRRRLYTRAIKRTLLNAGDSEKVLEGPIHSSQLAVLGNKDLSGLMSTYLDVWRGGP